MRVKPNSEITNKIVALNLKLKLLYRKIIHTKKDTIYILDSQPKSPITIIKKSPNPI